MVIDSSLINTSSVPETFEVSLEAVQRFMEATGDLALEGEAPLQIAPPTFPTTFRMHVPGLELDSSKMQLLHGEQEYTYTRPLRIGEQVTSVVRVADVRHRSGRNGVMTFLVLETTGSDIEQQTVFTARSTLIVRAAYTLMQFQHIYLGKDEIRVVYSAWVREVSISTPVEPHTRWLEMDLAAM